MAPPPTHLMSLRSTSVLLLRWRGSHSCCICFSAARRLLLHLRIQRR